MAAKRKVTPPRPDPKRTWSQLKKSEQSARYSKALLAYSRGEGPNPSNLSQFRRAQEASEAASKPQT